MTQHTFILSREEKEQWLNRAHFSWPGTSARGFRKVKALIWVVETTPADSRTSEILAGKMCCSVSTYNEALLLAQQLGVIIITHVSGAPSNFWIDWGRIRGAHDQQHQPSLISDPSDSKSEGSDLKSEGSDFGKAEARAHAPARHTFISLPSAKSKSLSNLQIPSSSHEHMDGNEHGICKTEETKQDGQWWGRDQPLTKADLLQPASIERLFAYAVNRGRLQRNEFDRLRFEALCLYCARRGHIPGALLTRCVFVGDAVQYIQTNRDMDAAKVRIRQREQATAAPEPAAVATLAESLAVPVERTAPARKEAEGYQALKALAEKTRRQAEGPPLIDSG